MWSSSAPAEPWVPDVQSVAEGDENEGCNTRSMAEMSALSFRPGLATEPSTRLTEVILMDPLLITHGTGYLMIDARVSSYRTGNFHSAPQRWMH